MRRSHPNHPYVQFGLGNHAVKNQHMEEAEYFQQGLEYLTSKSWDQAATAFMRSIEIHPSIPQPHGNLGLCYALQGKKQEALTALTRALELDPEYEPAILHKAMIEPLQEGEPLMSDIKIIEYYKDYSSKKKSYIEDYVKEMRGVKN